MLYFYCSTSEIPSKTKTLRASVPSCCCQFWYPFRQSATEMTVHDFSISAQPTIQQSVGKHFVYVLTDKQRQPGHYCIIDRCKISITLGTDMQPFFQVLDRGASNICTETKHPVSLRDFNSGFNKSGLQKAFTQWGDAAAVASNEKMPLLGS